LRRRPRPKLGCGAKEKKKNKAIENGANFRCLGTTITNQIAFIKKLRAG
jgi:hypothetical protein